MSVDLAPLRDLLHRLKNPQKQFRTIHIAGTKGKGSVGALIEAGLHEIYLRLPILGSWSASPLR
jgi:dihydrofolate synthase / folylpolyglutamate synthase